VKPRRWFAHGVPIFARTFALLLAALAVAFAIGMVLLALRRPPPAVQLLDVVALLSTRMPSANPLLRVYDLDEPPQRAAGYQAPAHLRTQLSQWLGQPENRVRVYIAGPPRMPRLPGMVDWRPGSVPAMRVRAGAPPDIVEGGMAQDSPRVADSPFAAHDPARPPPDFADPRPHRPQAFGAQGWRPDSMLIGAFIATVRQPDGRWRVVERVGPASRIGGQLALMTLAGLIALLPLAWWFSRALSAPILRFARAADHMGQDAAAPPLPLEGPAEIVRAAASFNAMQARINRLVRERTQMVGAIAHDLRTPLARLSFRLDQLPGDAREKATADIHEMSLMIQSALDFIRDQHCIGARERFDLRLLVESVADDLADVGHDVRFAPGPRAPLHGDPLALRRMAGNLVDNALKYGQRARLHLQQAGDGYALWIDDDGPGVDPAGSEQLFMPFVRGDASRNRETGGIGLGLATARGIALAHGGDIGLENAAGGGLRVTVTLPRGDEA